MWSLFSCASVTQFFCSPVCRNQRMCSLGMPHAWTWLEAEPQSLRGSTPASETAPPLWQSVSVSFVSFQPPGVSHGDTGRQTESRPKAPTWSVLWHSRLTQLLLFWSIFLLMCLGSQQIMVQVLESLPPHGTLGQSSRLLASAWCRAGYCSYLGRGQADERFLCLSLLFCLSNK